MHNGGVRKTFIQPEQCVKAAYLYGPLSVNNNRMICKHEGECSGHHRRFHDYTLFVLALAHADLGTAGLFTG